jgi:hypothetical protein
LIAGLDINQVEAHERLSYSSVLYCLSRNWKFPQTMLVYNHIGGN